MTTAHSPLAPAKTIQLVIGSMTSPSKSFSTHQTMSTSIKRVHLDDGETPTAKKRVLAMTPPSSDSIEPVPDFLFKLPALPFLPSMNNRFRETTPSTSTVAFSSSPRRSSPPPAPILSRSRLQVPPVQIQLQQGETIIFGRHRHHLPSSSTNSIRTIVPIHLHHLLHQDQDRDQANQNGYATVIPLAREAKHASRVHAVVQSLPERDMMRVVVVGQNGIRLRERGGEGGVTIRMGPGSSKDLSVGKRNGDGVELDFYGSRVVVLFPQRDASSTEDQADEADEDVTVFERTVMEVEKGMDLPPSSSPMNPNLDLDNEIPISPSMSIPPSSPPANHSDSDDSSLSDLIDAPPSGQPVHRNDLDELSDEDADEEGVESARGKRLGYPTAEEEEEEEVEEDDEKENLFDHNDKSIKLENLAELPLLPISAESAKTPLPKDVDLPALIASTVVFSGSSKLSLPDLVKHLLETQPSLRDIACEYDWSQWIDEELGRNEMFGMVARKGKDSSGRPLLPHYFYNPSLDPDTERATQFGGFVRPLRAAQRAGGKAIDWRPVGRARR